MPEPITKTTSARAQWQAFAGRSDRASGEGNWLTEARPRLRRLARLRGVSADAVEDVVQETLLEAWRHRERIHTPQGADYWLDEICRNICRRHARKRTRDQRYLTPLLFSGSADEANNMGSASPRREVADERIPDPVDALDREDLTRLLDRALGALPIGTRAVVEACYLMDLPQREIAERLGVSLSALEARLHRARLQLRQELHGALHEEAEALGLALDQQSVEGWRETRLWCAICGRRRLLGQFLPQPDGSVNLHMRCPECEPRAGLIDIHSSNVHSKGLIQLEGLRSFRPAWKRTMEGMSQRFTQALLAGACACPYCGAPASLQLIDTLQADQSVGEIALPDGLSRHPYQFWVWWRCPHCHSGATPGVGVFAASDIVYWSHPRTRRFMAEHPRWVSEPELLVEYAGQPALRLQMVDVTSSARLTALAHRQTLRPLAVF